VLEHEESKPEEDKKKPTPEQVADTTILPIIPAEAAADEPINQSVDGPEIKAPAMSLPGTLPPNAEPERINVASCPSCEQSHEYIEIKSCKGNSEPWTHWYTCPNTRDPVMLVVVVENGKATVLRPDFLKAAVEAQQSNRYLFGVFWVVQRPGDEEPQLYHMWFQHDFPHGDAPKCAEFLKDDFAEKVGPPPQLALPLAPKPSPMFNLLGDHPQNPENN
jgi:hypothetical protein